jgi:hemoglobin-like flavoprotein
MDSDTGVALTRLTGRQRRLLRHSFSRVARRYNVVASLLFDRLSELNPSLQARLPQDSRWRNRQTMETLALIVQHLDEPPVAASLARRAAVRAGVDRALVEHRHVVRVAFLWALHYGLATGYSAEVEQAWAQFYDGVIAAVTPPEAAANDASAPP